MIKQVLWNKKLRDLHLDELKEVLVGLGIMNQSDIFRLTFSDVPKKYKNNTKKILKNIKNTRRFK